MLPTDLEISMSNNLCKPSRQDIDDQQGFDNDLYADASVPSKTQKIIADIYLCAAPIYRGGGKTPGGQPTKTSPNAILHSHYYCIDGEPDEGDCAFDAIRMNIMAIIVRYPKAFDEGFFTRDLDLNITAMRHKLSTLIRS